MKTIWKYPIALADEQIIHFPVGANFLTAQKQGVICIWAEVESDQTKMVPVKIFVLGTGHPKPEAAATYLGTIQDGGFVWHVFADRMFA